MTTPLTYVGSATPHKDWLVKVSEVTAFFWIIKVLATTVGETFADFFNRTLGFGLNGTTLVTLGILIVVSFFNLNQLDTDQYFTGSL